MPAKVALALVGCGGISQAHVAGYQQLWQGGCRDFTVTAVCDLQAEAALRRATEIAAHQGATPAVFTDLRQLIAAGVADAADVCVPHCFHHSTAIPLLEGGLHVLCEKPVGITIRATKAIIAAAQRARRIVATAENVRRDLAARAATWAITEAKLIGEPVTGSVLAFSREPLPLEQPAFKWRARKLLTGGGMIMDSGAHFTDMMLRLFGPVRTVSCTMRTLDGRVVEGAPIVGDGPVDVESYWHADIRFASGMQVAWSYGNAFRGPARREAVYYGTGGTIVDHGWPFHPFQGGGSVTTADGGTLSCEELKASYLATLDEAAKRRLFPYGVTDGFGIEVWDFIDAVASGRAPEMDGTAGLLAKTLCECCYESATIGRPVSFQEVLEGRVDAYQRPIDEYWKLMPMAAAAG